jgi:hypothetical protein
VVSTAIWCAAPLGSAKETFGTESNDRERPVRVSVRIWFPIRRQTPIQALGVNDNDEVVGDYTDGSGAGATTHGFTWTRTGGFSTVDDPFGGVGTTTINGLNKRRRPRRLLRGREQFHARNSRHARAQDQR